MNKQHMNKKGFAAVEMVLVVVGIAILLGGGYWVWKHKDSEAEKNQPGMHKSQSDKDENKPVTVPEVNNASDLDSASKAVDQVDPDADGGDAANMDAATKSFY